MSYQVIHKFAENMFVYHCVGCGENHFFQTSPKLPAWQWNSDFEKPTVSPSIRVGGTFPLTDEQHAAIMRGEKFDPKPFCCHFFIKNGMMEFCGDCTHENAGKTLPMIPFE